MTTSSDQQTSQIGLATTAERFRQQTGVTQMTSLGFDVTAAGQDWMRFALDPLCQGSDGDPLAHAAKFPDNSASGTVLLLIRGQIAFTPVANLSENTCWQLVAWNGTGHSDVVKAYGNNDVLDPTLSPTFASEIASWPVALQTSLLPVGTQVRISGAAINAIRTSADTGSAGFLCPYWTENTPKTALGSYNTYGTIRQRNGARHYTTGEGITVRMHFDPDTNEFNSVPAYSYSGGGVNPYGEMPGFCIVGSNTTTSFLIRWVYALEFKIGSNESLFPQREVFADKNFAQLISFVNHCPEDISGHSFGSFMSGLWKGAKNVASTAWKARDTLVNLLPGPVGAIAKTGLKVLDVAKKTAAPAAARAVRAVASVARRKKTKSKRQPR